MKQHLHKSPTAQKTMPPRTALQRKLQIRPPGKGEASAFDRAQELIDRLDTISPAISYELKGQDLEYKVKDATALTYFDKKMMWFIDHAQLVPMRLVTSAGYVGGNGNYQPVFADSFRTGYVDLDDLMKDDLVSFQSDLVHFLTERFQVKDYARRIGTNIQQSVFDKAHAAGKQAEAALLQDLLGDASIVFVYEETKANGKFVNFFKSVDEGYSVYQVTPPYEQREIVGGTMWVRKKDGTRLLLTDFLKERAAAAGK